MATLFSVHTSYTTLGISIVLITCFTIASIKLQQTKSECVNEARYKLSLEHGTAEAIG